MRVSAPIPPLSPTPLYIQLRRSPEESVFLCVCVCVCEREREKGRQREMATTVPRVESLAKSGMEAIPTEYVRLESERLNLGDAFEEQKKGEEGPQIPVVDLKGFDSEDEAVRRACVDEVRRVASEWGVMHIVNHGIPLDLIEKLRRVGKEFFDLPIEEKEKYANDQSSGNIAGYGSKLANNESGKLEWMDYFFHLSFPHEKADMSIWPKHPADYV